MHGPAPNLPSHWHGKAVQASSLADTHQAKMNVFVAYYRHMCSHTVLRVYCPEHGTVFWDPAGAYGKPEYPIVAKRKNDLVVHPVPTVADYLNFRQFLSTPKMEVFEFDLKPEKAAYLINQLRPAPGEKRAPFKTATDTYFCATKISKFLNEHAGDILPVQKNFFPHTLSATLYQSKPSRVVVYDPKSLTEYRAE